MSIERMAAEFFANLFHDIPHISFKFGIVDSTFALGYSQDYVQSLIFLAAIVILLAVLLLSSLIITWVCQCCARGEQVVKSRRRVRRLSFILFAISVLCFVSLGVCLFGNDRLNRGVNSATTGLGDVGRNFRLGISQCNNLNDSRSNGSRHVDELSALVRRKAAESPGINQTLLHVTNEELKNLTDSLDSIRESIRRAQQVLNGLDFLENSRSLGDALEFERWVLLATLLSIMITVFFIGVISFCRQSKKGAVTFSAMGIVIFIVAWLLSSAVLPFTVGLADFCLDGRPFLQRHMDDHLIATLDFYQTCQARTSHDNVPTTMPVLAARDTLRNLKDTQTPELTNQLKTLFNNSADVTTAVRNVEVDLTQSLLTIGALISTTSCYTYHDDLIAMQTGFCSDGILGAAILLISLFILDLLLFILLLIVSKSWRLFTRLPSDYVEVDEDDPFFPRTNNDNSTIPVDIYGTHVFNPRSRFVNSLDRTEPSTGTTIADGRQATLPLNGLTMIDEVPTSTTPLWQQRSVSGSGQQQSHQPPPAVGHNSITRSLYPAEDPYQRYRNYQEQFDV